MVKSPGSVDFASRKSRFDVSVAFRKSGKSGSVCDKTSSLGRSGRGVAVGNVHNAQALPEHVAIEVAIDADRPVSGGGSPLPPCEVGEPNQFQIEDIQFTESLLVKIFRKSTWVTNQRWVNSSRPGAQPWPTPKRQLER